LVFGFWSLNLAQDQRPKTEDQKPKMRLIRKFFQLPVVKRRLALKTFMLIIVVRIALWILPFSWLQEFLNRFTKRKGPGNQETEKADLIAWAVTTTSSYVPRATCLTQALVAQLLLARAGFPSELHFGVMKDEQGAFKAHAWVESQNQVIVGDIELAKYTPME
jgi:hypothetical protein